MEFKVHKCLNFYIDISTTIFFNFINPLQDLVHLLKHLNTSKIGKKYKNLIGKLYIDSNFIYLLPSNFTESLFLKC